MKEIWKWVPGYEGTYKVSNHGRVKSVARITSCNAGEMFRPERVLSGGRTYDGYHTVGLYNAGTRTNKTRPVHQLVLAAFKGPRPSSKHEGRHLDGDKDNNTSRNLKWGTKLENTNDRITHGTQFVGTGSVNGNALLDEKKVRSIWKAICTGTSVGILAEKHLVGKSTIENIKYGRNWNHITGLPVKRRDNVSGPRRT
jgi:hypothetical protein